MVLPKPLSREYDHRESLPPVRELLVIFANQEAEWIGIDEDDMEGLDVPDGNINLPGTPVIPPEERHPVWEEDSKYFY